MGEPTLTVIVPCYNVEAYLNRCVDSILAQSYKNLDILIIDDGSTDGTPALCDRFVAADRRIRVVHQKNKGLSVTRKVGIEATKSEYVTFVDADDWIHPQMYENMMGGLVRENADIAQCGVCDVSFDEQEEHRYQDYINGEYKKYGHKESFFLLMEEKEWRSYFWNKIYRTRLFQNVTFPIGRGLDEDTSVMHQLFHNARLTIYFRDEYYFYFHRKDSITGACDLDSYLKKIYDRLSARLERYEFVAQHQEYADVMPYLKSITLSMSIAALRTIAKYPSHFPKGTFESMASRIKSIAISKDEIDGEWLSKMKQIEMRYLRFSPPLYKMTIPLIYRLLK